MLIWDFLQGKGNPELGTEWGKNWFEKISVAEDKNEFFRRIVRDYHNRLLIETNEELARWKLEGMPKSDENI